jgi:hypothetical protein
MKLFVSFETGAWRPLSLKDAVKTVFDGWDIKFGDEILPDSSDTDRIAYQTVLERIKDAYVVVDLTGDKRLASNGINSNVILEYGMALAVSRKAYAIYCSERAEIISRQIIEDRISNIKGCAIYPYANQNELIERLKAAKVSFESHANRQQED